mgnify:CR=1 FL=1
MALLTGLPIASFVVTRRAEQGVRRVTALDIPDDGNDWQIESGGKYRPALPVSAWDSRWLMLLGMRGEGGQRRMLTLTRDALGTEDWSRLRARLRQPPHRNAQETPGRH